MTVTRGLHNIVSCSERRVDGLHEELCKLESVDVHVNCRKKYTENKRISAALKRKAAPDLEANPAESPIARLRSTAPSTFNIKVDCMFCAVSQPSLLSTLCGRLDKNNVLISVRRIDWKAELEKKALERKDE